MRWKQSRWRLRSESKSASATQTHRRKFYFGQWRRARGVGWILSSPGEMSRAEFQFGGWSAGEFLPADPDRRKPAHRGQILCPRRFQHIGGLSEIVSEKTARPFSRRFGRDQGRRHAVPRNAKRRLRIRPDRILGRERCCNRLLRIPQLRMTEAVGADGMTMRVRRDIMNDIVVTGRADAGGNIVEVQLVAHLPGDDVIRAGRGAAETDRAVALSVPGV